MKRRFLCGFIAIMLFFTCFCTFGCSDSGFKPIRRLEMYGKNKNDFSYLIKSFGSSIYDVLPSYGKYITEEEYFSVPIEQLEADKESNFRNIEDDYVIPKKHIGKTYYIIYPTENIYKYKRYFNKSAGAWQYFKYSVTRCEYDIPYAKIVNNKTIIVRYGYDMTEKRFENIDHYNIVYHKTE